MKLDRRQIAATINRQAFMLAVDTSQPYKTLAELTAAMKAKGSKATYATYATSATIAGSLYKAATGIEPVEVVYRVGAQSLNDMQSGQLDFGIYDPLFALSQERAGRFRLLAIVAPDHPLAARRQVSLAQVVAHPLALPAATSTLRQLLDISCSRQGLPMEPVITSDHLYPLIQYAACTRAVTFCGELALRQQLHNGSIAAIPLRDREMNERHFEVQTMAGRHLPDAARAFIDHLRETLAREG